MIWFNLILGEKIIPYSRTFVAPQVQTSWNQARAPPLLVESFPKTPRTWSQASSFGGDSHNYKTNKLPCFIDRWLYQYLIFNTLLKCYTIIIIIRVSLWFGCRWYGFLDSIFFHSSWVEQSASSSIGAYAHKGIKIFLWKKKRKDLVGIKHIVSSWKKFKYTC